MLTIKYQAAFKKDYKRIVKRGYDMRLLEKVIELLANQNSTLEATFKIWQPVTTRLKTTQRCGVTWY